MAPLVVATLALERGVGLLGRESFEGAILLRPAFVVHTFGMRFPIDVAFCDRQLRVIAVVTVGRNRVTRPRLRARAVVEAAAGAFCDWGLVTGSRLRAEPGLEAEPG